MLALARTRVTQQGITNVALYPANGETIVLDRAPDAILFSYTHDLIRSPAALDNIFRQAKARTRIVAATASELRVGGRPFAFDLRTGGLL